MSSGRVLVGGQFRILRELGTGGFGIVYEVETVVGGLRRALKLLLDQGAEGAGVRERFVNEALILEQINHPNVARCFAVGSLQDTGELYLLLELVEGPALSELIPPHQGLPPTRATRLARQIASGLAAAHETGVLHRDLKPENILIERAGHHDERVKVVDFGIAKWVRGGDGITQHVSGTPEFMAPEQFVPGSPLDARVDLYALGATLFAMLTGSLPYEPDGDRSLAAVIAQHSRRRGPGPKPSSLQPELKRHGALDTLVSRLLSVDPEDRPGSARQVIEELSRIEYGSTGMRDFDSAEVLAPICAEPSEHAWAAVCRYLMSQDQQRERLLEAADRELAHWPPTLRPASISWWVATHRGGEHPLWPLARCLDLSGQGLSDEEVVELAESSALSRVEVLDLSRNQISNEACAALARSPHLRQLVSLNLGSNRISSSGIEALADGDWTRLEHLSLRDNGVGDRGVLALSRLHAPLTSFDMSDNPLGVAGGRALVSSGLLAGLHTLSLTGTDLGSDGAAALAVSPELTSLSRLDLEHNGIGPSGAAALALSEHLAGVRVLALGRNRLGHEGLQLLVASQRLVSLEDVDLSSNGIGAAGAMLLAGTPTLRRVRRLNVSANDLEDAGLVALLGSTPLSGLKTLLIRQNQLSLSGVRLLGNTGARLLELDVSENQLGDDAAPLLGAAVRRLGVRSLSTQRCKFSGAAASTLLKESGARLKELYFDHNALGDGGLRMLGAATEFAALTHVGLQDCNITAAGVEGLFANREDASLCALALGSNDLADRGAASIAEAAHRLPRLNALSLPHTNLSAEGVVHLSGSALAAQLRHLDLSHNPLGDEGVDAIGAARWPALLSLRVQRVGLTASGASTLAQASRLSMLGHLDLSDNALTNKVDLHSLSQAKTALMEASFAKVVPAAADLAERFYSRLFETYPSLRPLFAGVSMKRQQRHLVAALVMVVDNLRNPDKLESVLHDLGQRHVGYGALPTHYYAVSDMLLSTLAEFSGDDWSEELHDAWSDGLDAVCDAMQHAPERLAGATVRSAPPTEPPKRASNAPE